MGSSFPSSETYDKSLGMATGEGAYSYSAASHPRGGQISETQRGGEKSLSLSPVPLGEVVIYWRHGADNLPAEESNRCW